MSQFFIKRGDKAHGPFSESQIKAGLKSGKLSQKDLVSKDRSGPWRPIKIESRSEPARATPATKTQAAGDSDVIFEDAQIKITKKRVTVTTELTLGGHDELTEDMVLTTESVFLTFDPHKVTSLSLSGRCLVHSTGSLAKKNKMVAIGTTLIFGPVTVWGLFFVAGEQATALKLAVPLLFVVAIGVVTNFVAAINTAKPTNCWAVRINLGDGKAVDIPFFDKTDAMEVLNILDNLR